MDEYDRLSSQIKTTARICTIIVLAIPMGIFIMFMVLKFPQMGKAPFNMNFEFVMVLPLIAGVALSSIIPPILVKKKRELYIQNLASGQNIRPSKLLGIFQEQLITKAALLELPAFGAIFGLHPEKDLFTLMSIIALTLGIIALIPTEQKIENWLSQQMELIEMTKE